MTFASSLDLGQDPKCLTLCGILKTFFFRKKKMIMKKEQMAKKHEKLSSMQDLSGLIV